MKTVINWALRMTKYSTVQKIPVREVFFLTYKVFLKGPFPTFPPDLGGKQTMPFGRLAVPNNFFLCLFGSTASKGEERKTKQNNAL